MADINQVQLPDGSQYNITDTTSGYATQAYVQSAISGITKATIGLGNVDNTSDANKPVSTAQQTALDAKTNTSVIAYTETSTTATKRYEIGDQFILSGVLYTATAIIANGGTITVGTNCSASDTIVEQLANIGGSADNITFDNTGTDLTATNVQNAIVEVYGATKHGIVELWENLNIGSTFAGQAVEVNVDYSTIDSLIVAIEGATNETRGVQWFEFDKVAMENNSNKFLNYVELNTANGDILEYQRPVSFATTASKITLTFGDCTRYVRTIGNSFSSSTGYNNNDVPIRILGLMHNS